MATGDQGNGLTDPSPFTARVVTATAGAQVRSADYNDIQDGVIDVSGAVDALAAKVAPIRTSTTNQADGTAPTTYGGSVVWVERDTNGTTVVELDDSIDWRDRFIQVTGQVQTASDRSLTEPGVGGADDNLDKKIGTTDTVHHQAYTQEGQTGSADNPGVLVAAADLTGSDSLRIFARDTDGALCMRKDGTVSGEVTLIASIMCSPVQNHY